MPSPRPWKGVPVARDADVAPLVGVDQRVFLQVRCCHEPAAIERQLREIIFIELMTSDRKLKASREGSK